MPPGVPCRNRLWGVLLILRQLLSRHHAGQDWQAAIEQLLEPLDGEPALLTRMGLPAEWFAHPLWNLA